MDLKFTIPIEEILKHVKEVTEQVEQAMDSAAKRLAEKAREHIVHNVGQNLHSTKELYLENLSDVESVSTGLYVITLDEQAMWLEEGTPSYDMKPGLLKNNAKTSKEGHKYKAVAFDYSEGSGNQQQQTDIQTLDKALRSYRDPSGQKLRSLTKDKKTGAVKSSGVSRKTIEYNADGSPREGKLHEIDLGGRIPGKGNTRQFERVNIYQKMEKGNIRREVKVFRTVSDNPASGDKWQHPGIEAKLFMDKAYDMAIAEWEQIFLEEFNKVK